MPTVTIDGQEFDTEAMSENARAQMASIALCDQKLRELQGEIAILQTAKRAYSIALKSELDLVGQTPSE